MTYEDFLAAKTIADPATGIADPPDMPPVLFPYQRDIVRWALRRGRAAIFAGTGLGKSLMELCWGSAVAAHTGKPVLLLTPLAVAAQMVREAEKFGIPSRHVHTHEECGPGVNVTNYQKLDRFDLSAFGGIILDESSILKNSAGHYRTKLIEACASIPFRLAATATPAPNDFMELGNHAEFLGVMKQTDMLACFFTHDGGETQKWMLKGHAHGPFWRWMCSWAVMLRSPADLGYDGASHTLPPLVQKQHTVAVEYAPSLETGLLFPVEAKSMGEKMAAKRDSLTDRVQKTFEVVTGRIYDELAATERMSQCGSLNTPNAGSNEPTPIPSTAPSGTSRGRRKTPSADASTCAPTSLPIGSASQSSVEPRLQSETSADANATHQIPQSPRRRDLPPGNGSQPTQESDGTKSCAAPSASALAITSGCTPNKAGFAPSAAVNAVAANGLPSITATQLDESGGFCADHAIGGSASLKIKQNYFGGPLPIWAPSEPWLIWCHLNAEQDALEKAFKGACISVRGSMTEDDQERAILDWLIGKKPIMIAKPSMMGFGLNFQHCADMGFVGLNDSFEQVYQAIRRCWRFGQTKPVNVHFIAAETEGAVVANLRRKEEDADRMAQAMVAHMADLSAETIRGARRERADYNPTIPMELPAFLRRSA